MNSAFCTVTIFMLKCGKWLILKLCKKKSLFSIYIIIIDCNPVFFSNFTDNWRILQNDPVFSELKKFTKLHFRDLQSCHVWKRHLNITRSTIARLELWKMSSGHIIWLFRCHQINRKTEGAEALVSFFLVIAVIAEVRWNLHRSCFSMFN